ncbi:hypothetical protein PAMP_006424 [Pampus punctatissimus]
MKQEEEERREATKQEEEERRMMNRRTGATQRTTGEYEARRGVRGGGERGYKARREEYTPSEQENVTSSSGEEDKEEEEEEVKEGRKGEEQGEEEGEEEEGGGLTQVLDMLYYTVWTGNGESLMSHIKTIKEQTNFFHKNRLVVDIGTKEHLQKMGALEETSKVVMEMDTNVFAKARAKMARVENPTLARLYEEFYNRLQSTRA